MSLQAETLFKDTHEDCLLDLEEVEKLLAAGIKSSENLPVVLSQRLTQAGGKRIRPLLMSLAYRSFAHTNPQNPRSGTLEDLWHLATVAEWVHMATLFHDDVLDNSRLRRNEPAAHILYGNKNAILVGDFVYAEAFSRLMDRGLILPSQGLAQTVKRLVEGELIQHRVSVSRKVCEEEYLSIAKAKTGSLFAWCTQTGFWLAGNSDFKRANRTGELLGLAFQMADDILDVYKFNAYQSSETDLSEWFEAAPPLPVVLGKKQETWTHLANLKEASLEEKQKEIHSFLCELRDPSTSKASLDRVLATLDEAETILSEMKVLEFFQWATSSIRERGQRGYFLSQGETRDREIVRAL